jgi:GntR family transcriptional repressor for pyruvate dehydrogenase complex
MDTFRKIERQRLSHQVAGEVEEAIIAGRFAIGSRLPSEQTLANQFGVSRNAVREALKMMQARGLIEIVNGSGAYVAKPDSGVTRDALGRYLRLVGGDASIKSLYEVRKILEGSNARLAADRADENDRHGLADCLKRMKEYVNSIDQWTDADLDFHLGVARATHNPFLSAILEPLVAQLHEVIAEGYLVPGAVETGFRAHQRILKCIESGDGEGAYRAMMNHLHDSEQRVVTLLSKSPNSS